jgi:hypothetical protein
MTKSKETSTSHVKNLAEKIQTKQAQIATPLVSRWICL